ncbi:MAG: gamma-glutamylcyclotransferase family protein [Ferruginibacter sp.]
MHTLLFGYGSLINLESASKTLKRKLEKHDVYPSSLQGYIREWNIADDVIAMELTKIVKGIFLNIIPEKASHLNGILCSITDNELSMMKVREKNYDCVDVTALITCDFFSLKSHKVVTFIGKQENIIKEDDGNCYVFHQYVKKVIKGVHDFGKAFNEEFNQTTMPYSFPTLHGDYQFVDAIQNKSR